MIEMTIKIISLLGIGWEGSRKNYQSAIIWMALSNMASPTVI